MTPSARIAGFAACVPAFVLAAVGLVLAGCGGGGGGVFSGGGPRSAPIPDRVISMNGNCTQTEEDGFREKARLRVADNRVEALDWQLWVGRKGSCRFQLSEFRQTRLRPHIELADRSGSACRLMVYQSPQRITLSHAQCERHCTGGVYDNAWPVMFDPDSGSCAQTG